MYIQWFVKGISGRDSLGQVQLTEADAFALVSSGQGIMSNWWRNHPRKCITPSEIQIQLTERNLDRHIHDYKVFGAKTPFISLASGSVERDAALRRNNVYSAVDTALDFATDAFAHAGALFYGWVPVAHNPAVKLNFVAEAVSELSVYRRWSLFQLEGEITAKVYVPANQISLVEWWDPQKSRTNCIASHDNIDFVAPTPVLNMREHF